MLVNELVGCLQTRVSTSITLADFPVANDRLVLSTAASTAAYATNVM